MLGLSFHHIGLACRDLDKDISAYQALGYNIVSDIFEDQTQNIRALFIEAQGQPRLELIQNLQASGPLDSWLQNGCKMYHLAYQTNDIERDFAALQREHKAKPVHGIVEATYFSKIAFLMLPNMALIELIQQ